jgi:hypothetical protein
MPECKTCEDTKLVCCPMAACVAGNIGEYDVWKSCPDCVEDEE